jgi:hypothetical protein
LRCAERLFAAPAGIEASKQLKARRNWSNFAVSRRMEIIRPISADNFSSPGETLAALVPVVVSAFRGKAAQVAPAT